MIPSFSVTNTIRALAQHRDTPVDSHTLAVKSLPLFIVLLGVFILSPEIIESAQVRDDPTSQTQDPSEITVGGVVIDGPPPPIPPSVITRDGGQATMRAIRLTEPLEIDGRVVESVYHAGEPV